MLLTKGSMMDITPGEKIEINIDNCPTFPEWAGVWIDMNGDNTFTAAECINGPSGPIGQIPANASKKATLTIPCVTGYSGMAIMRVRCFYSSGWTASQGCGTVSNYGNILDFEVNISKVSPPVANFTVPAGPNYVKVPLTFNSNVQLQGYTQSWDFPSGNPIISTGPKGRASYNSIGTYDVYLKQEFCGYKDSIFKPVTIVKPSATPVADFIASNNQVEVYYSAQLFDLSKNGAYVWNWTITSPTGVVYNYTSQNPTHNFDEEGKWDVCLESYNDIGWSTKVCKSKYIDCTPPSEFYLGPNKLATNQGGTIYDNGGPDANYGNNRKVTIDYFKILPCGAKEIRLRFKQLKFADVNDKLRIYDGQDESGTLLTPSNGINSTNQSQFKDLVLKATSGAMYMTFESNAAGVDSGFIAIWDSELLPPTKPKSNWATEYNPAAIGMAVHFESKVTEAQGNVGYEWLIDGNPGIGYNSTLDYAFTSSTIYDVCLVAATCNGNDTFCKSIVINTPSSAGYLDFTADKQRPPVGDVVKISTNTDYASNFEWSIYPPTFSYVNNTNANSRNPQVTLNAGGSYTFTLIAWNAAGGKTVTEKKLIKNKYVIAVTYCNPPTDLLSSDIGINRVTLSQQNTELFENESTSGDIAYTDYTDQYKQPLTFGTEYTLRVLRRTNVNPINYKAWIDYNIDGDFDDVGELILNTGSITGIDGVVTFKTPTLAESFQGETRMRVAASYGSFSNTSCGVNTVGEFEDYGIVMLNDKKGPEIILLGDETVTVEKGSTLSSCYRDTAFVTYTAIDPTEGDLTNDVVLSTDLDCTIPGTYYINYTLKDAAGNEAPPRRRTVIVVLDKTAPVLTLNGPTPMIVEQCDAYNEPGAVAVDGIDGNLSSSIKISGTVNSSVVGTYTVTYSVVDAQGNKASLDREVQVVDTKRPGIYLKGSRITNNQLIELQIGSVFLDEVYAEDECNGLINVVKTPGYNGFVNTLQRATYTVTYTSADPSGNLADENGYVVRYRVDDYVAPEISLNTGDTIIHDVNTKYSSQQVSVFDNYYPVKEVSISRSGAVDPYKLGLYSETYTAIDGSGNVGVRTRYVKVVDRQAPKIITSAVNVCAGDAFWAMSGVIVSDNYYAEEDLLPLVKVVNHNVNIWKQGMYFINYQVTDPSGNESQVIMRPVWVQYGQDCESTYLNTDKISIKNALNVFPNPATDLLNVELKTNTSIAVKIELYNVTGTLVYSSKAEAMGNISHQINTGTLSNGTYILKVSTDSETESRKIVISK